MHMEPLLQTDPQPEIAGIPTNTSSQHTSEDCVVQDQKTMDENELNDDHCFKCNRKGEIYCCDRCFRAFHKSCITTRRFSKVWNCEYCNNQHLCLACLEPFKQQPSPQDEAKGKTMHTCTICFRSIHRDCCSLPLDLMRSQSHFFTGADNFVCEQCIRNFGFKVVLTYQKVMVQEEEVLFYFVIVNTRSPIHCGWFKESTLREVPRCKEADEMVEAEVCEVPKIERIIRMKMPADQKDDYDFALSRLLIGYLPDSPYGSENSFYFLVIWQGKDLTCATWQDQAVIKINTNNNPNCRQLSKFLLYRRLEISLRDKRSLTNSYLLFDSYLPSPAFKPHNFQYQKLYTHFKQNFRADCTFYGIQGENANDLTDFVCLYLQETYKNNLNDNPILIVCSSLAIARWQRRVKETCGQLNVIALKGGEANIYEIKQNDFFYQLVHQPKFQVLLIPSQRWTKERKFLSSKGLIFTSAIFDIFTPQLILQDQIQKPFIKCSKRLILLDSRKTLSKIMLTIRTKRFINLSQTGTETFIYNFGTARVWNSEMKEIARQESIGEELERVSRLDQSNYAKSVKWDEMKRMVFLRFILAFGFNYEACDQIQKLYRFARGVFSRSQEEAEVTKAYTQRFMAALFDHKKDTPRTEYLKFYLMDAPVSGIYKRICKLGRLKKLVQEHRNRSQDFPIDMPMKVFAEKSIDQVTLWRNCHDYLLGELIIERGYGRWVEIGQQRHWQKWASSCHLESVQGLKKIAGFSFGEYLKMLIQESLKRKLPIRIEKILSERGEYLLALAR